MRPLAHYSYDGALASEKKNSSSSELICMAVPNHVVFCEAGTV